MEKKPVKPQDYNKYTYMVSWCQLSSRYCGRCPEFPQLSSDSHSSEEAFYGIKQKVRATLKRMHDEGLAHEIPQPGAYELEDCQ